MDGNRNDDNGTPPPFPDFSRPPPGYVPQQGSTASAPMLGRVVYEEELRRRATQYYGVSSWAQYPGGTPYGPSHGNAYFHNYSGAGAPSYDQTMQRPQCMAGPNLMVPPPYLATVAPPFAPPFTQYYPYPGQPGQPVMLPVQQHRWTPALMPPPFPEHTAASALGGELNAPHLPGTPTNPQPFHEPEEVMNNAQGSVPSDRVLRSRVVKITEVTDDATSGHQPKDSSGEPVPREQSERDNVHNEDSSDSGKEAPSTSTGKGKKAAAVKLRPTVAKTAEASSVKGKGKAKVQTGPAKKASSSNAHDEDSSDSEMEPSTFLGKQVKATVKPRPTDSSDSDKEAPSTSTGKGKKAAAVKLRPTVAKTAETSSVKGKGKAKVQTGPAKASSSNVHDEDSSDFEDASSSKGKGKARLHYRPSKASCSKAHDEDSSDFEGAPSTSKGKTKGKKKDVVDDQSKLINDMLADSSDDEDKAGPAKKKPKITTANKPKTSGKRQPGSDSDPDDPPPRQQVSINYSNESQVIVISDSPDVESDDDSLPDINIDMTCPNEVPKNEQNICVIDFEPLTAFTEVVQCTPCYCANACLEHATRWLSGSTRCYHCNKEFKNVEVIYYFERKFKG